MEWQVSQQPAERVSVNQGQEVQNPMVTWGPSEAAWSQNQTCRQVGDTIVCSNAFANNSTNAEAFRAILPLQQSMGLIAPQQAVRVGDSGPAQAPPYYRSSGQPDGYYEPSPSAYAQSFDTYGFNQGTRPGQIGQPGTAAFDPYAFNQNDDRRPGNPGTIPPYIKPGGHDVPVAPPRPADVPVQPAPQPRRPADVPLPPMPQQPGDVRNNGGGCQPQPDIRNNGGGCQPQPRYENNCQPCQPRNYQSCQPSRQQHWYPGKIAGRVLGRVFGGRGGCH